MNEPLGDVGPAGVGGEYVDLSQKPFTALEWAEQLEEAKERVLAVHKEASRIDWKYIASVPLLPASFALFWSNFRADGFLHVASTLGGVVGMLAAAVGLLGLVGSICNASQSAIQTRKRLEDLDNQLTELWLKEGGIEWKIGA